MRDLAQQWGFSKDAVERHKANHIPASFARAVEAKELANADNITAELRRVMGRINLLYNACHEWLQDPDNPAQYSLDTRAEELRIIYREPTADGKVVRRKARLADLLPQIERAGRVVEFVESRRADPRELILKTSQRLEAQLELLAKLLGQLTEGPTINFLVAPEWLSLRNVILTALGPHPQAKLSVVEALLERTTPNGLSN
jgi:hypothetical protein